MKIIRKGDKTLIEKGVPFILDLFGKMVPAVYTESNPCLRCPIGIAIKERGALIYCSEWVRGCIAEDCSVVPLEDAVE